MKWRARDFLVAGGLMCCALLSCFNHFTDRDSCAGITCSDHGRCADPGDGTGPVCLCFDGYHREGLDCVADSADGDADGDVDGDTDADTDADSDADSDADGDTDGDTDGDGDGDSPLARSCSDLIDCRSAGTGCADHADCDAGCACINLPGRGLTCLQQCGLGCGPTCPYGEGCVQLVTDAGEEVPLGDSATLGACIEPIPVDVHAYGECTGDADCAPDTLCAFMESGAPGFCTPACTPMALLPGELTVFATDCPGVGPDRGGNALPLCALGGGDDHFFCGLICRYLDDEFLCPAGMDCMAGDESPELGLCVYR